jgi:hypothetical protein
LFEAADPAQFLHDVEFFMNWAGNKAASLENGDPVKVMYRLGKYAEKMGRICYGRKLFVTERVSMGLLAPKARIRDRIAYIPGAYQPFVLCARSYWTWEMTGDLWV